MPPSDPPDRAALDWLAARLYALDEVPLIAALSDAEVAGELRDLGLNATTLRPPFDAVVGTSYGEVAMSLRRQPERHRLERPAVAHAARRARWRTSVVVSVGLLALVVASTFVLRPPGDGQTLESAEFKSSASAPQGAGAMSAIPAERTTQQIARLQAFSAGASASDSRDTTGVSAAISDVRRAYDEAAAFEAIAKRPLDPTRSSSTLAALLRDAYTALGVSDSARAFARRITP